MVQLADVGALVGTSQTSAEEASRSMGSSCLSGVSDPTAAIVVPGAHVGRG